MNQLLLKESMPEDLRDDISVFFDDFTEAIDDYSKVADKFHKNYRRWLEIRTEMIHSLNSLSDLIDKHDRNVNIASLSGASVSLLSGGACLAGLALAPFTGGLSVLLTTGGLLGTSAGTLTVTGAQIAGFGLKKSVGDKARTLLENDCKETLYLTHLIDICLKLQSRILDLLQNNNCAEWIQMSSEISSEIVTDATLKDRIIRVKGGSGSVEDILIILSVLLSDNSVLKRVNFVKSCDMKPMLLQSTLKIGATLRSSLSNIRKCATIIRNWRNGLSAVNIASKMSRVAKGALVGISMMVDVVEIGSTVKGIIKQEKSEESKTLQDIIVEMNKQTDEVIEYYNVSTLAG